MPRTKLLPPWARVREVGRTLLKPIATPGWIVLVLHALDWGQRVQFVKSFVSKEAIDFAKDWGWIAGLFWLAGVVLWAAARTDAIRRAIALANLEAASLEVLRQFETLCRTYEKSLPQESVTIVGFRRTEFLHSVGRLMKLAMEVSPQEERSYRHAIKHILENYSHYYRDEPSLWSIELPPVIPFLVALGIPITRPPEDPPTPTASEQSPPSSPESS